jgi:hypothetical protein
MGKEETKIAYLRGFPSDLWRETKAYAAWKGLRLPEVVEAALRKYLNVKEPEAEEEASSTS